MGDLQTPVVFIMSNRPEPTRRVLETIIAARPPRLFVIADGPHLGRPGDAERCAEVRRLIDAATDELDVVFDAAATNLGCGQRVRSGLDAVFAAVDRAIIVEDDCLPDPGFFGWCETLLERYEDDPSVGMVCGTNDLIAWDPPGGGDYFPSRHGSVWGWATWRRAWQCSALPESRWDPERSPATVRAWLDDALQADRLIGACAAVDRGEIDTWDYGWTFTRCAHRLDAIVPIRNLVTNVGFGEGATHTTDRGDLRAGRPRLAPPVEPVAPAALVRDPRFDLWWAEWQAGTPSLDNVVHVAGQLLAAGSPARAMVVVETYRRRRPELADHPALLALRRTASSGART